MVEKANTCIPYPQLVLLLPSAGPWTGGQPSSDPAQDARHKDSPTRHRVRRQTMSVIGFKKAGRHYPEPHA